MNELFAPIHLALTGKEVTGGVMLIVAFLGGSILFLTRREQWSGFARNTVLAKAPGLNILQRYVLAEIFPPIIVSGQALSFLLMIQVLNKLIDLLMAHWSFGLVLEIVIASLPTVLSMTIPIAILLGTLLSVGRMAVDNEVRAMQTAGVHLMRVFWPMMALSAVLCLTMIFMNYFFTPKLNRRVDYLKTSLLFEALSSLPAGIPNDEYELGDGAEMTFYFREREPGSNDMLDISMMVEHKLDKKVKVSEEEARKKAKADKRKKAQQGKEKTASAPPVNWMGAAYAAEPGRASENQAVVGGEAGAAPSKGEKSKDAKPGDKNSGGKAAGDAKAGEGKSGEAKSDESKSGDVKAGQAASNKVDRTITRSVSRHELLLAARGHVEIDADNQLIYLHLVDGSIHPIGEDLDSETIAADMAEEAKKAQDKVSKATGADSEQLAQYARDVPVTFGVLTKPIKIESSKAGKNVGEYTVIDMMRAISLKKQWFPWAADTPQEIEKNIRKLKVEWCTRTAIPMACVSFCLIGASLAIFVRPSGKSVGVVITFGLILIYYWMIKWGSSTAEEGKVLGYYIIFLPNFLMGGIGAYLMRRAINQ